MNGAGRLAFPWMALIGGFCLFALPARGERVNPLYRMFPDDLRLLVSFDDDTAQPDVGAIDVSGLKFPIETAEGGVIGRCLATGRISFPATDVFGRPLADFGASGTILCWVRYVSDVPTGTNPGISFFNVRFAATESCSSKRLLMMKEGHADTLDALYEYVTDRRRWIKAVSNCAYRDWPKGEWRMCVMTWTQEKIGVSKNGEKLVEQAYDSKFGAVDGLSLSAPMTSDGFYQLDEFAVLGRKLSDAEIRLAYDCFLGKTKDKVD